MNDIYEHKAKKYKYKYLELKAEYFGGGNSLFGIKWGISRMNPLNRTFYQKKDYNKKYIEDKQKIEEDFAKLEKQYKDTYNFEVQRIKKNNQDADSYNIQNPPSKEIQITKEIFLNKYCTQNDDGTYTCVTVEKLIEDRERIKKQQQDHDNNPDVIAQRARQIDIKREEERKRIENEKKLQLETYGEPGVSYLRMLTHNKI